MSPKINIVTGNHAGRRGIEDYIHFLHFTLSRLGYTISESLNPQNDVAANIWIEDFFSNNDFQEIISAKENRLPEMQSDEELFNALFDYGYQIINFPIIKIINFFNFA